MCRINLSKWLAVIVMTLGQAATAWPQALSAEPRPLSPASEIAGHGQGKVSQQTPVGATIELRNSAGLRWQLQQRGGRWTLGTLFVHDKPVDSALASGLLALRSTSGGREIWPAATDGERTDGRTARFSGSEKIGDTMFRFEVEVALKADLPAATLAPRWSVDKDLSGYEVCLAYHGVGDGGRDTASMPDTNAGAKRERTNGWRCTVYPFAGNARGVQRDRLTYVGVPAVLMFREDTSLVTLFGIDPAFDYLDPTTWTGATGFHFDSGRTPPQYRIGGKLLAGVDYSMPLQIVLSDAGNSANAVTQLVRTWIKANDYKVQPLKVRSHQEAFDVFLEGRRKSKMWRPGLGYQIMENWPVVYTAESPINAYFDYLLYELTGDPMWRERAFETIALVLRASTPILGTRITASLKPTMNWTPTRELGPSKSRRSPVRGSMPSLSPAASTVATTVRTSATSST